MRGTKKKKKGRGKEAEKTQGSAVRDQTKSRKFWACWQHLPSDVKEHVSSLSRAEQTEFIHSSVDRNNGKLVVKPSTMYQLMIKKQEKKAGLERMAGYIYEDPN